MENYGLPANDKRDYPVLHAYSPNCPISKIHINFQKIFC